MKKIYYIVLSFLLAGVTSCSDDAGKGVFTSSTDVPVATFLDSDELEGYFSLWVDLLNYTDFYNAMNLSKDYTCFVPDDRAVSAFLQKNGYSSVEAIDLDYAKEIVKYHTIQGIQITGVDFEDGLIPDTTATGDFLSLKVGAVGEVFVNDEARIYYQDVKLSNGVLHILETMLTPVESSLYASLSDEVSIFKEAIDKTGYSQLLNTISYTDENHNVKKYKYTLFTESNQAFAAAGISSFDALAAKLGAGSDYTSTTNALNRFVSYHIIGQQYDYTTLASDTALHTLTTLLDNELISYKDADGTLLLNYNSSEKSGVALSSYNKNCKNGIRHTLASMMNITTPERSAVTWEFTDYSDLSSLFSSVYRLKTLTSASTNYISVGDVSCYEWQSVPVSSSDAAVAYYVSAKSASALIKAENYDYLMLRLGQSGYVEMTIPTIVKGKYKATLYFYSSQATATYSPIQLYLDNSAWGSQIYCNGVSSSKSAYTNIAISEVEFTETTSHKLRILAGDNSSCMLDCIKFTPIYE